MFPNPDTSQKKFSRVFCQPANATGDDGSVTPGDDVFHTIDALVDRSLGVTVASSARVSGGDVAESFRLSLSDGRTVFAKTHSDPPVDFFRTEAVGLEWLRAPMILAVPRVLAVGDSALVLEWISEGAARSSSEADLGRGLAELHHRPWPCFGRDDHRTTGSRQLPNDPTSDWPHFYAENRLLPLARLARDSGALGPESVDRLVRLAERLPELGVPDEPPSLLHGDLWAGNRVVDVAGVNWLIDPAAHGGHREFDLAMMRLFGGYGAECFAAYDAEFPLAAGWEQRVPLHQLAPLVVHAIKFGGGYGAATVRALDACDRLPQ